MPYNLITTIITTINRPTLIKSIMSVLQEHERVIVVYDGFRNSGIHSPDLDQIPHKYRECITLAYVNPSDRCYGCKAFNYGVTLAETEYITKLDDDDEFAPGAISFMSEFIRERKDGGVARDIYIPQLLYADGCRACVTPTHLAVGNVACPTIRREAALKHPIVPKEPLNIVDFTHVHDMVHAGCSIEWYLKDLILVRPNLPGRNGLGRL